MKILKVLVGISLLSVILFLVRELYDLAAIAIGMAMILMLPIGRIRIIQNITQKPKS